MDIDDLIRPAGILASVKAKSKRQLLQELAGHAAELTGLDERAIFDVLLERERLGTTGVGQGVAIPHGKIAGCRRVMGVFARAAEPIDFEAVDDRPVDLFVLLLAPEDAGAEHLKALATVSRLLRDRNLCDKLRGSANADAIAALLLRKEAA